LLQLLGHFVPRLELCADEMVVGGGVGWSYDRRQRRHTGWESTETAHSPNRRRRRRVNCEYACCAQIHSPNEWIVYCL